MAMSYRPKPGSNVEKILNHIESNPDSGVTAVASKLGLPWRTVQMTTRRLIKRGYLEDRVDGRGHHHFYVLEVPIQPEFESEVSDKTTQLFETIIENPGIGYAQLTDMKKHGVGINSLIGALMRRELIEIRLDSDGQRGFYEAGKFSHLGAASDWPWPATLAADFLDHISNRPGIRVATAVEEVDPGGSQSSSDRVIDRFLVEEFVYIKYDDEGHRVVFPTGKA